MVAGMNVNPSSFAMLLNAVIAQGATLLVYLAGIVLAAMWWRRAPRAAMLTVVGLAVMLISSFAAPFAQVYFINNASAVPGASLGQTMVWVAAASSLVRAVGLALLVGAVFVNRPHENAQSGFEVHSSQPPPMPR